MAQPATKNLSVTRGDTFNEDFFFKTELGTDIDLTDWTAKLDVRRSKDAGITLISLYDGNGLTLDSTSGKITVNLKPSDTANINFSGQSLNAVYDLEMITDNGTVLTPVEGAFTILKDVTREVPGATLPVSGDAPKIFYDPRDYGAVMDGVFDDTNAFKNVLADAKGKGTIIIPVGKTLTHDGTAHLPDNTTIWGASRDTSVIKLLPNSALGSTVLRNDDHTNGNSNISIWNLTLDANQDGHVLADNTTCTLFFRMNNLHISNCNVTGSWIDGIYVYLTDAVVLNDIISHNNGTFRDDASGIHLETCTNASVTNAICHDNGFHGIILTNTTDSYIQGVCYNNGFQGVHLQNSADRNVISVNCHDNFRGVYFIGTDGHVSNNVLSGCTFNNNVNHVLTNNASNIVVTGCTFTNNTENDIYLVADGDSLTYSATMPTSLEYTIEPGTNGVLTTTNLTTLT